MEIEFGLEGEGVDIHKVIGMLPRPKEGWTERGLFGDKRLGRKSKIYFGPYNNLSEQLVFDKTNGKIIDFIEEPAGYIKYPKVNGYIDTSKPNSLDFWAAVHDVQYSMADIARKKALAEGKSEAEANKIALAIKNKADYSMSQSIKQSKLVNIRNPLSAATHYGMRLKNFIGFGVD